MQKEKKKRQPNQEINCEQENGINILLQAADGNWTEAFTEGHWGYISFHFCEKP
jgi:hypothetical protein